MRRLPPDRHVECLVEDWVDLVPQRELHHLHSHDDATPAPSSRRFRNVVASSPPASPPSPAASSPDAWLALAEESMRPPRVDAPAAHARRAAQLVRACATALAPRGVAPEGEHSRFSPPAAPRDDASRSSSPPGVRSNASSARRRDGRGKLPGARKRTRKRARHALLATVAVAATALAAAVVVSVVVSPARRSGGSETATPSAFFSSRPPRSVRSVRKHPNGRDGGTSTCDERVASAETMASLRSALERARALTDALRRNVTAREASAEAWRRASETWYDAFAEAVETNAALTRRLERDRPLQRVVRTFREGVLP